MQRSKSLQGQAGSRAAWPAAFQYLPWGRNRRLTGSNCNTEERSWPFQKVDSCFIIEAADVFWVAHWPVQRQRPPDRQVEIWAPRYFIRPSKSRKAQGQMLPSFGWPLCGTQNRAWQNEWWAKRTPGLDLHVRREKKRSSPRAAWAHRRNHGPME